MASQSPLNLNQPATVADLVKIETRDIHGKNIQTVNARDLHSFLENGDNFTTWIKQRIEQYGFVENQDFVSFLENTKKPLGGRPAKEYAVTLDMAKELSMVERNRKGKEARQYFIECERRAKSALESAPLQILNDPAAMRGILLSYTEKVLALEATVKEQAPKVAALDRIATSHGSMCITDAAKCLQMRPSDLFDHLSRNRWIYRRQGRGDWVGYQNHIQAGHLEHKVTTVPRDDGTEKSVGSVLVTPPGLSALAAALGQLALPLSVPERRDGQRLQ